MSQPAIRIAVRKRRWHSSRGVLRARLHHMQGVLRGEYTLRLALPDLVCALDLQAVAPLHTQPIETDVENALSLMQQLAPIIAARLALAAMPVSHRRSPS